jgi:hypothetical protein
MRPNFIFLRGTIGPLLTARPEDHYGQTHRMRQKFLLLFFVATSVSMSGQAITKSKHHDSLETAAINYVRISRHLKPKRSLDTTIFIAKVMRPTQSGEFVKLWNAATYDGICENKDRYFIDVFLKDGSRRDFSAGKKIKEGKNYCFSFDDTRFFDRVWEDIGTSTTNK